MKHPHLTDCLDDLHQFNCALLSVVDMLAACDDVNTPPASYLWNLLAILSRCSDNIEGQLKAVIAD